MTVASRCGKNTGETKLVCTPFCSVVGAPVNGVTPVVSVYVPLTKPTPRSTSSLLLLVTSSICLGNAGRPGSDCTPSCPVHQPNEAPVGDAGRVEDRLRRRRRGEGRIEGQRRARQTEHLAGAAAATGVVAIPVLAGGVVRPAGRLMPVIGRPYSVDSINAFWSMPVRLATLAR